MSYTALYRRLRPRNFEQVIGQEPIIKTLKNQVKSDRISHAYLFCGTRGTGKTSTAKIMAKLLNCKQPVDNSPCDKCDMCISFNENRNLNIIEIDAASNNSVEDIREIREEVKYPPTNGRFKVYIIDEVHMLSIGAFNALLKTLEEPPSYVIFILATTDPHKIPVTILSRCQRFDFKRISDKDISATMKKYMKNDNIDIDEDALDYIAKISDGAMRDALSILDQCISFYDDEKITLDKVLELVGAVDDEIFFRFIDAIVNFSTVDILAMVDEIVENGRDISQFVADLIEHIRNLLVVSISENGNLNISNGKLERLKKQAENIDKQYLIKLIENFSEIQNNLKFSFDERIVLETGCIKQCIPIASRDITDIKQKIKFLEKKIEENSVKTVYIEKDEIKEEIEPIKERELAILDDIKIAIENFDMVKNKFKMPERVFLDNCEPKNLEDRFLYLVCNTDAFMPRVENIKLEITNALYELFNKQYEIKIISKNKYKEEYKKVVNSATKEIIKNENNSIQDITNYFPDGMVDIE